MLRRNLTIKQRAIIWGYGLAVWLVLLLLFVLRILFFRESDSTYTLAQLHTDIQVFQNMSWLLFLLLVLYLVIWWTIGVHNVVRPLLEIRKRLELFQEGIIYDEMFDSLMGLSPLMEAVAGKLQRTLDKNKMIENSKQQKQ